MLHEFNWNNIRVLFKLSTMDLYNGKMHVRYAHLDNRAGNQLCLTASLARRLFLVKAYLKLIWLPLVSQSFAFSQVVLNVS